MRPFLAGFIIFLLTTSGFGPSRSNSKQDEADLSKITFNFRPNILWLSVEDISPTLAAYGDSTIDTPNIDRLAREGVVFDKAFTTAGVCAPNRSSIISGMYASHMGTLNMRTYGIKPPEEMKPFSIYMQRAGYYTTNNTKEDYNFSPPKGTWDARSHTATWQNRPDGEPFFSIFNFDVTHESRIWRLGGDQLLVDPDDVPVPDYYPKDDPVIRHDIARNYSNIKLMDFKLGKFLDDLEEAGQLDSTIIVFWSDHGGPLPRQKREVYFSGIHVPMIIRFPHKLMAGKHVKEPVSLMDLGPTMMALAGADKPAHMDGKVFIGPNRDAPRKYAYAERNRMDSQYDMVRTITDGRYQFVKNYYPEKPNKQAIRYRTQMALMRELNKLHRKGQLGESQEIWFNQHKPLVELYDTQNDPDEVHNLAGDPEYQDIQNRLSKALENREQQKMDLNVIPEKGLFDLQSRIDMPIYNFLQHHPEYYRRVREIANKSLHPARNIEALTEALQDTIPASRYWALRGIGRLGNDGSKYHLQLLNHLDDSSELVRISAAWALCKAGDSTRGLAALRRALRSEDPYSVLLAANIAGDLGDEAKSLENTLEYVNNHNQNRYATEAAQMALKKMGNFNVSQDWILRKQD